MIDKSQSLKGKTKTYIFFFQIVSSYHDQMNNRRQSGTSQFEEDAFSKNAKGIGKFFLDVLLLKKFLQTKLQNKSMNILYYDLYYTVIKIRDEKGFVVDEDENIEKDYDN